VDVMRSVQLGLVVETTLDVKTTILGLATLDSIDNQFNDLM